MKVWNVFKNIKLAIKNLFDKRISFKRKVLFIGITLAYMFSPVDLIPDFLSLFLGLGYYDDGSMIIVGTYIFNKLCQAQRRLKLKF